MSNLNPPKNIAFDLAITLRRVIFSVLSLATAIFMLYLVHQSLRDSTPLALRITLLALFALTLPWMVVGFWNAIIGLFICQCFRDPMKAVFPAAMCVKDTVPLTRSTAILLCIRNESPARLIRNLQIMLNDLVRDQLGPFFHSSDCSK